MKTIIDDVERDVFITKKRGNKNTYLRVKEDLNIYITTNYYTPNREIEKLIEDNKASISKMILRLKRKQEKDENFMYLGKKYDIIYLNTKDIVVGQDKIFLNRTYDINKWFLKEAKRVFKEELDKIYEVFPRKIPYPSLTIRTMKTRWGVCNTRTKRVTLNLELIKKDIKYLDYVVAHELSHLVYPNHSKDFWALVELVIPNYKELRKEMREYE